MKLSCGPPVKDQPLWFLNQSIRDYIPHNVVSRLELVDSPSNSSETVQMEDYLRQLFLKSPADMRRYGSVEELAANLLAHQNFSGAFNTSSSLSWHEFTNSPTFYSSVSGGLYVRKQDMLGYLGKLMVQNFFRSVQDTSLSVSIFYCYMKHRDSRLDSRQFVLLGEDILVRLDTEVRLRIEHNQWPKIRLPKGDFETVLKTVKDLIPEWHDVKYERLVDDLKRMCRSYPPERHIDMYEKHLNAALFAITVADDVTSANPMNFLPDWHAALHGHPRTVFVRVFEDATCKFVMTRELEFLVEEATDLSLYPTIALLEAMHLIWNRPDKSIEYELLKTGISRSKHSAQPIRTPDMGNCKMAADVFMEVLHDLIFGLKVFQRMQYKDWGKVEQFFTEQSEIFKLGETDLYFIRLSEYVYDKRKTAQFFSPFLNGPANDIRPVGPNGFTLEDLNSELKYLGLDKMFPEITARSFLIYNHIRGKLKNGAVLQTSDLYEAVEQCQLTSILEKIPSLLEFLHNQNGCQRIHVTSCCPDPKYRDSNGQFQWPKLEEQPSKNKKKNRKKKKKAKKENLLEEPEEPEEPEPPVDEVTELRRKVEELEKKLAAAEQELGERKRKESSGCGKCHRTSEKCEEAKKEAKGFRNKVEKLEKKLTAAEKEAKEAEERFGRMEVEVKEAVEESMQQLNLEKDQLSSRIEEKNRIIGTLKQMVPREQLSGPNLERTSEMRKMFFDLQMKQNEMRAFDSLGSVERQVGELKRLRRDPVTQRFAEVQRLQFRVGYERYSTAIDRNIAMMQEDLLTTQEELLPVPEFPTLSSTFHAAILAAREEDNAKIEKICVVCHDLLEESEWEKCVKCSLKYHLECANKWRRTGKITNPCRCETGR